MEKDDLIFKYNFILNKFKELFYNYLLKKYSPEALDSMNLTDYIFEMRKIYPREEKSFNLLSYLYIDSNEDLALRVYDLMNLYEYMKGVIGNDK